MKRVHVVNPYGSAAMTRMVQPLLDHLPALYEVTTSEQPDIEADVNIHMPFHTLVNLKDKGKGRHIAVYTHCNVGFEYALIEACNRADIVTAMTYRGRDELLSYGIPKEKIWVVYCAADDFAFRKRLVGIIGYPQPTGRKRESLLLDLAWQYDMTPYEFILTGQGWEGMTEKLRALGVSASWHHADTFESLTQIMRLLDVLLVTGYREGGPLPLLECMAAGVPVLSPDFGYAADLLDSQYKYETVEELHEMLTDMFSEHMRLHQLARARSWNDYAAEYALLIGRLTNTSTELFPKAGMDRYCQLLDIIDQLKPRRICEIGTWNGKNAARMIQAAAHHHYADELEYQGFDLFDDMDMRTFTKEHSKHPPSINIVDTLLKPTGAHIHLIQGNTRETIKKLEPADLYFVDGGHSEATIQNDGFIVLRTLKANHKGVAVFDDYYHGDRPQGIGCNKFIDSLDPKVFNVEILPILTTDSDGNKIGMVKVTNADIPVQMQNDPYHYTYSPN